MCSFCYGSSNGCQCSIYWQLAEDVAISLPSRPVEIAHLAVSLAKMAEAETFRSIVPNKSDVGHVDFDNVAIRSSQCFLCSSPLLVRPANVSCDTFFTYIDHVLGMLTIGRSIQNFCPLQKNACRKKHDAMNK